MSKNFVIKSMVWTCCFILSIIIHQIVFSAFYNRAEDKMAKKTITVNTAILLEKKTKNTITVKKYQKIKITQKRPKKLPKKFDDKKLISLGKEFFKKQGAMPSISINYSNSRAYISHMYKSGAKTVLYDTLTDRIVAEVDVLNKTIFPITKGIKGYSPIKRVIRDDLVNDALGEIIKNYELGEEKNYQILLLVPEEMEFKWLGKIIAIAKSRNLSVEQISHVDFYFDKKLRLTSISLKDGKRLNFES